MARFDENVARRLETGLYGVDAASCRVQYSVLGSAQAIAINRDGSAFARVNLTVSTGDTNDGNTAAAPGTFREDSKVLICSLVSLDFVKESHLIKSVAWCVLNDITGTSGSESVNETKSDATAKESLESQIVYPSVVSFDGVHREKAKDRMLDAAPGRQESVDQMEEPGMSF